jgi:hypothetical protein
MAGVPKMQERFSADRQDGSRAEDAAAFFAMPSDEEKSLADSQAQRARPAHAGADVRPRQ